MKTPILIDSSFLYSIYNTSDPSHKEAFQFALQNIAPTLVPMVTLPEVTFLFKRDFGYVGMQRFLQKFSQTSTPLEPIIMDDLKRASEIAITYGTAEFDLVDCCIMALSERLNITQICTFDRRDFSIFRPKHCAYLELLP